MENSILQKLSKLTQIIYLDTPVTVQQEMYRLYLKDPKPVIWGKSFYKVNGESNIESLSRCYPKLLAFRSKRYENITNIRFDYTFSHSQNFSVDEFMEVIKK